MAGLMALAVLVGKFLLYAGFYFVLGKCLGEGGASRALIAGLNRFWMGLAGAVLWGLTGILLAQVGGGAIVAVILTVLIWVIRAGVWALVARWMYPSLRGNAHRVWAVVAAGLALNLLIDLILWLPLQSGGHFFAPTLGGWSAGRMLGG